MNNVSLVGRLTKDPELRTISTGSITTTVTVAINRTFANQAGERIADFISVVVWNKQAENLAKYCKKGSLIGITGRIQTGSYDAKDGTRKYVTEVLGERIKFLGSKNDIGSGYQSPEPSYNNGNISQVETTDITDDPFKDFGSEVVLNDDELPF
ncbi:MAG: single-stranded DNA-binding protein [Bacilli bacterium]|nr:single-stranded DNA-binding protein [Bacilli bacterium]